MSSLVKTGIVWQNRAVYLEMPDVEKYPGDRAAEFTRQVMLVVDYAVTTPLQRNIPSSGKAKGGA